MGFIDSYKRLEKLCGEILSHDRPISAYIDEMVSTPRGVYLVSGWDDDLKQLKHYRWMRNQIAHDPDCSEENMRCDEDAQWLVDFHGRIMNQTDPLALYRKALQHEHTSADEPHDQEREDSQASQSQVGCGLALAIVFVIVVAVAMWLMLKA